MDGCDAISPPGSRSHLGVVDLQLDTTAWRIIPDRRARLRRRGCDSRRHTVSAIRKRSLGVRLDYASRFAVTNQACFAVRRERMPNARKPSPTRAVTAPIQVHVGAFDMNEPRMKPAPSRAHTPPARETRTPRTTKKMRQDVAPAGRR